MSMSIQLCCWNCNFHMTPHVRLLVRRSVMIYWKVGQKVTLPCSHWNTSWVYRCCTWGFGNSWGRHGKKSGLSPEEISGTGSTKKTFWSESYFWGRVTYLWPWLSVSLDRSVRHNSMNRRRGKLLNNFFCKLMKDHHGKHLFCFLFSYFRTWTLFAN